MKIVKKIALWLAYICMVIIKIPVSLNVCLVSNIEMLLIRANHWFVEEIDDDALSEGWNIGGDFNIRNCDRLKNFFISMKMEDED